MPQKTWILKSLHSWLEQQEQKTNKERMNYYKKMENDENDEWNYEWEKRKEREEWTDDNIPITAECNNLLSFRMQPAVGLLAVSKIK
jgi:hypothetical protein